MSFNPGSSWFDPFYEYDPYISNQCIFFTQKEARCQASCEEEDNEQAIELFETILDLPAEAVGIELIKDYILCSCCMFNRARHRERIEDIGLLTPLAQRWLDEIRRDANISINIIPVQPTSISEPPLSEFRAHIAKPGLADSVASKIQDILVGRDFETGWLYIFDRDSSPGHVKIGWTARSVENRLESWSMCGYTPNLLFVEDDVPHAQRAETLAQYEMIKEWRRERQCKAKHCGKSHQEWFEVSRERAKEVLGDWAKFMKIAEPYHWDGLLKEYWTNFVIRTEQDGGAVTAKKLLEQYELSLAEVMTPVEESVTPKEAEKAFDIDKILEKFSSLSLAKRTKVVEEVVELGDGLNTEEQEGDLWNTPKKEGLESPEMTSVPLRSLPIKQSASTKEVLLRNEASPELISPAEISLPNVRKQPKNDPLIQFKAPPDFQFSFAAELPSTEKLVSKTGKPHIIEPPAKTPFLFTVEPPIIKGSLSQKIENGLKFEPLPEPQLYPAEPQPKSITEDVVGTETLPKPQFSFTSELPFIATPLPEPPVPVKPESSSKAQFSFASEWPFRFGPSTKRGTFPKPDLTFTFKSPVKFEPFTWARVLPKSDWTFTSESPIKSKPSTEVEALSRAAFTFTPESQFRFEPPWKFLAPLVSDSVVRTEHWLKIKPPHESVAAEGAPADEEPWPGNIPLPPSPIFQPEDSHITLSEGVTEPSPSLDIEIQSLTDRVKSFHINPAATPLSESSPLQSSVTSSPKPAATPICDLPTLL